MDGITITQGDAVLAHHTTEHPRSSYGTLIWCIEAEEPEPGPAEWQQGDTKTTLDVIGLYHGWLVVRQADGFLCGIVWSDGSYYAETLVDENDEPATEYRDGLRVLGTIKMPGSPLGAILNV